MTEQEVRMKLLQLIESEGETYTEASKRLGYSRWCLGRMVAGDSHIPDPLLMQIGVKRVIHYEPR